MICLSLLAVALLHAQSPPGKMSFEVASVKPNNEFRPPSFPLDNGNAFRPGAQFFANKADHLPTKDEVRLMMQSLLAERFHLEIHFETEDTAVLALTSAKQGKFGPNLRRHSEGRPCDDVPGLDSFSSYLLRPATDWERQHLACGIARHNPGSHGRSLRWFGPLRATGGRSHRDCRGCGL